MSDILGNTKIILRNSLSKMNEKDKSELISENKYYALLNKKRRRNLTHNNHKNTLSICPSCASSFLRKCYHHINENNNYFNNSESNAINKENKSYQIHEKKETLPKYQNKFGINNSELNENTKISNLFVKGENKANQETFSKNFNYLHKNKNDNIPIKVEKEKENCENIFNNNIKNDNNDKNINEVKVKNDRNNNNNEIKQEKNNNFPNIIFHSEILNDNNKLIGKGAKNSEFPLNITLKYKSKDNKGINLIKKEEKAKIEAAPEKKNQFILMVQKRVAPDFNKK